MAYIKIIPRVSRSLKLGAPAPRQRFKLTDKQLQALETASQVVLALALAAGFVVLAAVAPNIFQAFDKIFGQRGRYRNMNKKEKWQEQQRQVKKAIYYLRRSGQIKLIPHGDDFLMKVTKKGRKIEKKLKFADLQVNCSKKWDGHWWIIIADIPVDYRFRADYFREKLKEMKFYPLQKTVWVFPYDPRDEVDFATAYFRIERYVTYMKVSELDKEDEGAVKKFFRKKGIISYLN